MLLQDVLRQDAAYLPISSPDADGKIDPLNFVRAIRGMNCMGGAISRDIKGTVGPLLDELDPLARTVGSVNTVVRRPNGMCMCMVCLPFLA